MIRRTALASALLSATLLPSAGCWGTNGDTPVIEAEDVSMDVASGDHFRAAGERGDVYGLAMDVSGDTNLWVTEVAVGMSRIVRELNRYPEDGTDGDWRVYGPHKDEDGKDGAWMARIQGDENGASFEVYIGRRDATAADMVLLIDGDISVSDEQRDGQFTIDFDTIHAYADILDEAEEDSRYGGTIKVSFQRDLTTQHKQVEMDFDGFFYDDGEEDANFDGEHYTYQRAEDGSGQFHFAAQSSFEEPGWSGPELERMVVDMSWNAENAGRARGMILEGDGMGDLAHGDIVVHECFDTQGGLTWRNLSDEYVAHEPDYNFGEERSCVLAESDLEITE